MNTTPNTPISDQQMEIAYFINALERDGMTSEMMMFLRQNPKLRRRLISEIKAEMPKQKQAPEKFELDMSRFDHEAFKSYLKDALWNDNTEYNPFITWALGHPECIRTALESLSNRNGAVFIRYFGLYGESRPTSIKALAEEFGLSRERVRQIFNTASSNVRRILYDMWRKETVPQAEATLYDLPLDIRVRNSLMRGGITTPQQLASTDESVLRQIEGVGDVSILAIRHAIEVWRQQ